MIWYIEEFFEFYGWIFAVIIIGYMALKIGNKTAKKTTIILCIIAALFFIGGYIFGLIPAIACIAYDIGRSMKKK